jgi:hypothetical protein
VNRVAGRDSEQELAAYLCTTGRAEEGLAWAERAMAASTGDPAAHRQALILFAVSLAIAGRGPEGLARLDETPAAGAVSLEQTDLLVIRECAGCSPTTRPEPWPTCRCAWPGYARG